MDQENIQDVQDDASFEAGFNQARGDEPTAEIPPIAKEEPPAAAVSPAPEVTPEAPAEPTESEAVDTQELIAGLTPGELKAALAKAAEVDRIRAEMESHNRKVFGRFGELQGEMKKLMDSPKGQPVKITRDTFKRLQAEFPDLAELLAEDLSDVLTSPAQSNFDPAQLEEQFKAKTEEFNTRIEEVTRKQETKLLTMKHPGWRQTVQSDDFTLWKGTLPEDVRTQLDNSWDAAFISDALTAFDTWKGRGAQQANKRLESAITPQGVPAPSPPQPSEEDAFVSGFKTARSGA